MKYFTFISFTLSNLLVGIMLFLWKETAWVTPMGFINDLMLSLSNGEKTYLSFPLEWWMGSAFIFAGITATISLFVLPTKYFVWGMILLFPQQVLLLLEGVGPIEAIWESAYADGVIRSRAFIFSDQHARILDAIAHLFLVATRGRYET